MDDLRSLKLPESAVSASLMDGTPRRIAVLISGLHGQFLLASKLMQIVPSSMRSGYAVDFYIQLVEKNNGAHYDDVFKTKTVEPQFADVVGRGEYVEAVHQAIARAGANLEYFDLSSHEEDIELPEDQSVPRFKQYSPYRSKIGRNVVRRYFSLQRLATMALERHRYDFVLVTRDDDHFLGKLNITRFASYDNAANRVFSKNCKTWNGVNDKTLLFGGEAANRTLLRLYSDFWMPDDRLVTWNAEVFLKGFISITGAISTPVSFADIPTSDSAWVVDKSGELVLCQRPYYLCDQHPNRHRTYWQKLDQPNWCPDLWTSAGHGEHKPQQF